MAQQVRGRETPPPGDFGRIKADISEIYGAVLPLFLSVCLRSYQVCNSFRIFILVPFACSAHLCIKRDLCGISTARYPTMHLTCRHLGR